MASIKGLGIGFLGGLLVMIWGHSLTLAQVQVQAPTEGAGWLPRLDLSPDQMVQLRSIQQQNQGDLGQKTQELRQARQQLRQLLAGEASAGQVQDQYRRMQQLSRQVEDQRFEVILRVREVLTPEQRERMAELLESRNSGVRDRLPQRRPRLRP